MAPQALRHKIKLSDLLKFVLNFKKLSDWQAEISGAIIPHHYEFDELEYEANV